MYFTTLSGNSKMSIIKLKKKSKSQMMYLIDTATSFSVIRIFGETKKNWRPIN